MNDKPIKTQMTRAQLQEAVETYWNRMLCGDYVVSKMVIHARSGAEGLALSVDLEPAPRTNDAKEVPDHVE